MHWYTMSLGSQETPGAIAGCLVHSMRLEKTRLVSGQSGG